MIKIKDNKIYSNGLFDCCDLYSDIGMKIFDKRDGEPHENTYEKPIAVQLSRYNNGDYVETDEPIEPIEEVKDETKTDI